jgi:hypothetical protein
VPAQVHRCYDLSYDLSYKFSYDLSYTLNYKFMQQCATNSNPFHDLGRFQSWLLR